MTNPRGIVKLTRDLNKIQNSLFPVYSNYDIFLAQWYLTVPR